MLVTLSGMLMEVKPLQSLKAYHPISFTFSGMLMEVRAWQFLKAYHPILTTLSGIIVSWHPAISSFDAVLMMALQSFLES